MKVLFLSPQNPPSYTDALYLALRTQVGTCDFYALDEQQSSNLEEFFRRHIRLAHFDRILLAFDAAYIHQHSPFLRHLPTLAVLDLEESDNESASYRRMLNNFKTMPWLRWVGSHIERCHEYQDLGYDAYWVPPCFDHTIYHPQHRQKDNVQCHILAPKNQALRIQQALPEGLSVHVMSQLSPKTVRQIRAEDFFIYWPEQREPNLLPLIQAMGCGAICISRDPGLEKRVLYGWRSGYDALFINNIQELNEQMQPFLIRPERRRELMEHVLQKVKMFHPSSVGRRIGIHMEIPIRNPQNYPMKQRIFGFEI